MAATLARRERRPIWVALTITLAAASASSLWLAARARDTALVDGARAAAAVARSEVSAVLEGRDLGHDLSGEPARRLRDQVSRALADGRFETFRIYSPTGRVIVADDPAFERSGEGSAIVAAASRTSVRARLVDGSLETYVPLPMTVDGGHVVVELARPADDISAAGGAWTAASGATAALGLLGLAMVAIAGRTARRARSRATSLYEPAIPRRRTLDAASGTTARLGTSQVDDPATLAERLRAAGARADAAEESLRTVQAQLKQTLTYVGELEGRIGMEDERWAVTDREVKALRSQVSDTAERLHAAETDNDALRERLTVRQRELDDARHELALARFSVDELDDLRARLDTAEATAGALERELHRVEAELELTNDRFHMTKLAEALRELDEEDADVSIAMGDEEDDTLIARRDPRLPTGRTR